MKTIEEIRKSFGFKVQYTELQVKDVFRKNVAGLIDWNVYLPSLGYDLQRPFVWNPLQKEELIWSILLDRPVPNISVVSVYKDTGILYQIIDGKQRLSTVIDFIQEGFPIHIDGETFFWGTLPEDYKSVILSFFLGVNVLSDPIDNPMSDQDKIKWFTLLNFAGTKQDLEHKLKLQQSFSL
jgi:hypothetical protein